MTSPRSGRTRERLLGRRATRVGDGGPRLQDLVVITGFSGAGKSTAMHVFEDAGYFCVDNLPPEMLSSLATLFTHHGSKVERAAVVCDVRGGEYFDRLVAVLQELRDSEVAHRVLFLDADEQTLVNRYKETRRRHPAARDGRVADGIASEHESLVPLKALAEVVIDTDGLSAAMLRRKIADELLPLEKIGKLAVTIATFGFKHGPPRDADIVFDVRFLPNPHYEADLRPLTGLDPAIVEYIGRDGQLEVFYGHLLGMLDFLLPRYVAEGKAHLTIAIGCTGGRHRSVAIAEHLAAHVRARGDVHLDVSHRDLDKGVSGAGNG